MKIELQLDAQQKKTVSDLFFSSAQVPMAEFESRSQAEDSLAIFRIAKEFSLSSLDLETRAVDPEDLARMLRFTGWLLCYGGSLAQTLAQSQTDERTLRLQHFFATTVLQAQAQYSAFESLLKALGVDRQLALSSPHARSGSAVRGKSAAASVAMGNTVRTQQIQIRVDEKGADMTATTTESNWTVSGWKQANSEQK